MTTHETDPTGQEAPREPMGLEFDVQDIRREADRAAENGELDQEDRKRIIRITDEAASRDEMIDRILTEICQGRTSPYPKEFHEPDCGCSLCKPGPGT